MQKKRKQNKRMQIKPTFNVKITLTVNRSYQQNHGMCPDQHDLYFERFFRKYDCFCLNIFNF